MIGKLTGLKDTLWAIGIGICLVAVLFGLIFAMAHGYGGSSEKPGVDLGAATNIKDEGTAQQAPLAPGELNELKETKNAGQDYLASLTFICDSTMIGMRDYGMLSGGSANTQVWGSTAGTIPIESLSSCVIKYPADGSEISAATAAMIAQPKLLVLCVGNDGLASASEEAFRAAYKGLIDSIRSASPDTKIIVCSLLPVTENYTGADGLTNVAVAQATTWLKQVCTEASVYYADISSALTLNGSLASEYSTGDGHALSSAGCSKALEYLSTHAVG